MEYFSLYGINVHLMKKKVNEILKIL